MNTKIKHIPFLSTMALCAFLSACGGGGGGGGGGTTVTAPTPITEPEGPKPFLSPKFKLFNANPNGIDLSSTNQVKHLWVTDGTSDGTKALSTTLTMKNVRAQLGGYLDNGKKTIFAAFDSSASTQDIEPYISDGTAAGTSLLKDLNPNNSGIDRYTQFIAHKNKVYFYGTRPGPRSSDPYRLYVTDGTTAGTRELANSSTNTYTDSRGYIYKFASFPLVSDGKNLYTTLKAAGGRYLTVKVLPDQTGANVFEPVTGGNGIRLQGLYIINGQAYGTARISGALRRYQVIKLTDSGIQRPFSNVSVDGVLTASPTLFVNGGAHINDDQYAIHVRDGNNRKAIYFKKDGSTQVVTLKQPNNTAYSRYRVSASYINDKGLYVTLLHVTSNAISNVVFPINNGTLSGTATPLSLGNNSPAFSSGMANYAPVGNTLVFASSDHQMPSRLCPRTRQGEQLWAITGDSTVDRIKLVNAKPNGSNICTNAMIRYLGNIKNNSLAVFQAYSGTNNDKGQELWVTDGTTANTKMLKDIAPGLTNTTKNGASIY